MCHSAHCYGQVCSVLPISLKHFALYWLVMKIHQIFVDSLHKGSLMWMTTCHSCVQYDDTISSRGPLKNTWACHLIRLGNSIEEIRRSTLRPYDDRLISTMRFPSGNTASWHWTRAQGNKSHWFTKRLDITIKNEIQHSKNGCFEIDINS